MQPYTILKEAFPKSFDKWKTHWYKYVEYLRTISKRINVLFFTHFCFGIFSLDIYFNIPLCGILFSLCGIVEV